MQTRNDFDWTYDSMGRLISEVLDSSDDSLDYVDAFAFDLNGNRLKQTRDWGSTSKVDYATTYTFDNNDRLITESQDNATGDDSTTTYGYTGTQQSSKSVSVNSTLKTTQSFSYDLQGRMTMVRLETMNAADTTIASVEETSFEYDTGGTRVASVHKIDSTNDGPFETIRRTEYLTDHANPTGYSQTIMETETSANGTPIKRTVYTIGHDQISQTVYQAADTSGNGTIGPEDGWGAGVTHYFGMDGNGSVRVLYDALAAVVTSAANVLQVFHYDAYGNLLNIAATSALTSYLYSGEAFDTRINQQYLRARWYDPAAGRFTSLDPFRGNTSDPQSLHKYLYVHDDPVNGIDPSGLFLIGTMQISSIRNHLANLQADAGLKLIEGVYRLGKGASIAGIGLEFVIGDLFGIGIPFFGAAFKRLFNVIGRQSARVLSKMLPKVAGEYLLPGIFHVSANEISRLFSKQLASELNKGVDGAILRKEIARLNGLTQASLQGVGIQFHHVIPKELKNHPLFLTVHMNFDAALNALPLNQIVHYTDHPNYTSGIRKILDEIHASSLSNGQKREKLLQTITNANCSILGGRRGRPVTPDELSPTEWQRLINPFNEG